MADLRVASGRWDVASGSYNDDIESDSTVASPNPTIESSPVSFSTFFRFDADCTDGLRERLENLA
jgi:hypothetical protein